MTERKERYVDGGLRPCCGPVMVAILVTDGGAGGEACGVGGKCSRVRYGVVDNYGSTSLYATHCWHDSMMA